MRVLVHHLNNVAETLRVISKQLQIANHGVNVGAAREALISSFLQQHLAESVSYFTGEILDHNDDRSGQIDVIVHPKNSPRIPLLKDVSVVFSDSVLAAIEVKSNLTTASGKNTSHFKAAFDSCVKTKKLSRATWLSGCKKSGFVHLKKIPVFIFAFNGPTVETLRQKIYEYQLENNVPLDLLPDLITVVDRNYYLVQNNGWLLDKIEDSSVHWSHNSQPEAVLVGMYVYLTQIIEAYGTTHRPMMFGSYFRDLLKGQ